MEINEIEHKIACHEMTAEQVFTQMKQHINAKEVPEILPTFLPFGQLPKGTRFKYPDGKDVWVVLEAYGNGLIAKWEGPYPHYRLFQSICSFVDAEWSLESLVEVVC